MVRFDPHPVPHLGDGHSGGAGEDLRQVALVPGIEVLHEKEGHAAVRRQALQEPLEDLQAARRRTDPHDREGRPVRVWARRGQITSLIAKIR